jgi:hypothetical protein
MWRRARTEFLRSFAIAWLTGLCCVGSAAQAATQAEIDAARVKALAWLLVQQRADGSWRSVPGTEVTASANALEALARAGVKGYPYAVGVSWLANAPIASVDSLARKIVALRQANLNVAPSVLQLIAWRNDGGTWGAYDQFETAFPDTPLALGAIRASAAIYTDLEWVGGLCPIVTAQRIGDATVAGSWSYIKPATTPATSMIVPAILPTTQNVVEIETFRVSRGSFGITCGNVFYDFTSVVDRGRDWLLTQRRNADGGFGEGGVSSVLETALVYQALTVTRSADQAVSAALHYLVTTQGADGSWNGDALQTAQVLKVFPRPAIQLVDTDRDGIPDAVEAVLGTNPGIADSRWLARGTGNNFLFALTPATAVRGGTAFMLTVDGEGFNPGSVVQWNGTPRPTTFVSSTRVQASIPAADLTVLGTAVVTVFTPAPGNGTSTPFSFIVTNPVPVATTLSPPSTMGGSTTGWLFVNGSNFVQGSVVFWNGLARTTTFVSSTELRALITTADLAVSGTHRVSVTNPAPGGGTSAVLSFAVLQPATPIVVDNGQPGTGFFGTWIPVADATPFGANSLVSAGVGTEIYQWTPTIPATGTYSVYVWWTTTPTRSTAVPYSVRHASGASGFTANQQAPGGGGAWRLFGNFVFLQGTSGFVQVKGSGGETSADAVLFVPAGVAGTLTVTKVGTGAGTVTSVPTGISCGTDCFETYPQGSTVTLAATPAAGSSFAGWTGDADCGDGVLTMTDNRNCTATFTSNDIVIDNGQVGATFTGTWSSFPGAGAFGADSLVSVGAGVDTHRWTPSIPTTRTYAVYVWWTSDSTRSDAVTYTVKHVNGQDTLTANQQVGGSQWQPLGTFTFATGSVGFVEVTDAGGFGTVSADAVRFVPQ